MPVSKSVSSTDIREALERVRSRIEAAAVRSGRAAAEIILVAVTKGAGPEAVRAAQEAGLTVFGENRVQEAQEKIAAAGPGCEWHLVGHLQSNKTPAAVTLFQLIHSVDSVRLAQKIDQEALAQGRVMPVLLEINISGEEQKYGFAPEEIYSAIDAVKELPNLKVLGLMGIAPNTADPEPRRQAFRKLKGLFTVCKGMIPMKALSMGMSDDFEIAIEEGSTMVRLGRAIFT